MASPRLLKPSISKLREIDRWVWLIWSDLQLLFDLLLSRENYERTDLIDSTTVLLPLWLPMLLAIWLGSSMAYILPGGYLIAAFSTVNRFRSGLEYVRNSTSINAVRLWAFCIVNMIGWLVVCYIVF